MGIVEWLARKVIPATLFEVPKFERRPDPDERRERERIEADRQLLERIEAVNAEVRMHERQLR